MAEFPIEAFLRTYQQKYANDQAAQERGPAASFGRGLETGINTEFAQQQQMEQTRYLGKIGLLRQLAQDYEFIDLQDPSRQLSPDEIMGNYMKLLDGQPTEGYQIRRVGARQETSPLTPEQAAGMGLFPQKATSAGEITYEKPIIDGQGKPGEYFDKESKLRDDFRKDAGDYPKIRDSYNRILASTQNVSPAGDLALIFNYMKMLDPNSVVREGEFATAANSGSIPEQIRARYNKVLNGERLSDNIRQDFINTAKSIYQGTEQQYQKTRQYYGGLATSYDLKPQNVLIDMGKADLGPAAGNNTDIKGEGAIHDYHKIPTAEGKRQGNTYNFNSIEEAESANLPKGTIIYIQGRKAVVE